MSKFMTRREFLAALAGFALIGIGGYPFIRRWLLASREELSLPAKPTVPWNGQTRSFQFDIRSGEVNLGNGTGFTGYLINQQFPGPEIHVTEGDRVQVTVKNGLDRPLTVHWHGVNAPNPMDGVPGITQDPILPGQQFTYDFVASPSGTRWYHSHVYELDEIPNGLFGPLIIHSTSTEPYPSDREQTLIFSTWGYSTTPGNLPTYGMMGGMGSGMGMGSGVMRSASPNLTYLVNGKVPSALNGNPIQPGAKLRLRLINASATESFLLQADHTNLLITHTDGNPLLKPQAVSELYMAPAERYDVILTPNQSGTWYLRSTLSGQDSIRIPFITQGQVSRSPVASVPAWSYLNLAAANGVLPQADHVFQLTLSGGMMGSSQWTINGASYPNSVPLRVRKGERIRIEMFNMSMMEHPMHLHGHTFQVTSFNGRILGSPLLKDTVDVLPMQRCTIDFMANNPGNWFFHCHNLQHMMGGLATVVEYQDYPLPHVDKWM